ncbi:SidJ-related pseudokinase, partial [Desulfosarcina cetonica]|uniref:SidJ-related pseudokinase n=1 Tax=Desulfosarcina cetonica TaxID=90730 RepID=UPI0006CFFE28
VDILAPPRVERGPLTPPAIDWQALLSAHGLKPVAEPCYRGRSLVMALNRAHRLLVVKLAQKGDRIEDLQQEIRWMERLQQPAFAVHRRFHVPSPLMVDDQAVFCINRLPLAPPEAVVRHPRKLAIAFLAHQDYFVYPNHHRIDGETAREILGRNAYIMGHLAGRGIIHDAPIPLFHNRTQRMRRDDQGRYQWFRAGRLDRWLDSCAFPNLGLSGLRDFEHLEPFGGDSRTLYRQIGSHFLSLLLVAGSHFRCRDRSRKGLAPNGSPVDTRDLFDPPLLEAMIREIFENYHTAFTGTAPAGLPLDLNRLVTRMIEEMGLDRYMNELFRRADQAEISDTQFEEFLRQRGFTVAQLKAVKRAEKDIRIVSGPHLGDFNRQISLPEIIEAVAAMAAVCMAGRFQADHR